MNSEFIQKFVSTLLRKPKSYYRSYKINKSSKHLCDIILRTQSNEEHHLIIDKDFSVYCFKFGQCCASLEKVSLQPHQQLKKFVIQFKIEQKHFIFNQEITSSILKRIIYLKSELKNYIDAEDYRKCHQLQNFIMKYK